MAYQIKHLGQFLQKNKKYVTYEDYIWLKNVTVCNET